MLENFEFGESCWVGEFYEEEYGDLDFIECFDEFDIDFDVGLF